MGALTSNFNDGFLAVSCLVVFLVFGQTISVGLPPPRGLRHYRNCPLWKFRKATLTPKGEDNMNRQTTIICFLLLALAGVVYHLIVVTVISVVNYETFFRRLFKVALEVIVEERWAIWEELVEV